MGFGAEILWSNSTESCEVTILTYVKNMYIQTG